MTAQHDSFFEEETSLTISAVAETLDTWRGREDFESEVKGQLLEANVLLLPDPDFRGMGPAFAPDAKGILKFLRENAKDVRIAVASNPSNYRVYVLHSVLIDLGMFIVTSIIAPIFVNYVSEYLKKAQTDGSDPEVRFDLKVDHADGSSIQINYSGPASSFDAHVIPALRSRPGAPVDRRELPPGTNIDIRI